MASESSRPTPLGVARERFVEGLPRKALELKGSVALIAATPDDERSREELRRRLHALYASAQVFQIMPLSAALKESIGRLDEARDERRPLTQGDIDGLASLAATLPTLGAGDGTPMVTSRPPRGSGGTLQNFGGAGSAAQDAETGSLLPPVSAPAPRRSQRAPTLQGLPGAPASVVPAPEPQSPPAPLPTAPPLAPLSQVPPASTPPTAPAPLRSSALPSTPPAARATPPVVSVLVVDGAEWQAKVRALLAAERFEVLGAADPEEALRLSRSNAPDVVLVDLAVLRREDVDLVARLHDDPLTDFVPIVAMIPQGEPVDVFALRAMGADDSIAKPLDLAELETLLGRHAGTLESAGAHAGLVGELTVEEIADRLTHELRRGLVESVDRGHDIAVPVGDGASLLSAAWSAIGRVRAQLAQQSGGRVHFRDRREAGGPAFLSLAEEESSETSNTKVSLRDRRIIVADDDPAVVWFFAGLLREEGAIVEEAADGAEALAHARRARPDVIISDIIMPRVDGFALTREVKRDPALADVPVILLSWKEDFLQRMRELSAGASGYLRKEAGSAHILESVRDVLRPRARLEARLAAGGDVRGRLDRMGVVPLLKTVAQLRPDARVTVRDAWNLFELDLREARLVDATRTASDGSFSRGPRVVVALLGAAGGRYSVSDADTPVRASIKEPLDTLLQRSAARLGAVVDAVSGRGLSQAASVDVDDDVVASLLRTSPEPLKDVVDALRAGRGPRALLLEGNLAPHELEAVLIDLARQGAVHSVTGPEGEDRVALALEARGETSFPARRPSALPPSMQGSIEPPSIQAPGEASAPAAAGADIGELDWIAAGETTGQIVADAHRMASQPPPRSAPPSPPEPEQLDAAAQEALDVQPEPAAPEPPRGRDDLDAPDSGEGRLPSHDPAPSGILSLDDPSEPPSKRSSRPAGSIPSEPEISTAPAPDLDFDDFDDAAPLELTPAPRKSKPVEAPAEPAAGKPAKKKKSSESPAKKSPAPEAPADEPAPAGERMGLVGWGLIALVLFVAGYAVVNALGPSLRGAPPDSDPSALGPLDDEPLDPLPSEAEAPQSGEGESADAQEDEAPPSVGGYGREEDGIAPGFGVDVPEGQGLVVLEVPEDGVEVRVRIAGGERRVGGAAVGLALPPGVHDVAFMRGDDVSFRFIRVRAGATRYVPAP